MTGFSVLVPIPLVHLDSAITILDKKEFVAFGSDAYAVLRNVQDNAKMLIYVSHEKAKPEISYTGLFRGLVEDPGEKRRLEKEGFRPATTIGEKWAVYWKISNIKKLENPIALDEIKLKNGKFCSSYPRGPMIVDT